jgi:chromosome partitioning protein
MNNVIAISNQKGGVGKTTSAVSLSAALAGFGYRTLLVDFDPQANATSGLQVDFNEEGSDLYDMFFKRVSLKDVIKETKVPGLFLAPSSKDLISIEAELGRTAGRELILRSELAIMNDSFDYIIIDCPPSSGLLTLNALGAASWVLVPLQAEYYALEGISGLMNTVDFVKNTYNKELEIIGVFLTMFDSRTNLSKQVEDEAKSFFGDRFLKTIIPRNIKLSEAPSHGLPISMYAPDSIGSERYSALAEEVLLKIKDYSHSQARALNA